MLNFLKSLICKHEEYKPCYNIYGDMINVMNGRSIWQCTNCKKTKVSRKLIPEEVKFPTWIFKKEWKTSTVVALATIMKNDGNCSGMPILADALQDAGCDQPYLEQMRDFYHSFYSGRWILDEILS